MEPIPHRRPGLEVPFATLGVLATDPVELRELLMLADQDIEHLKAAVYRSGMGIMYTSQGPDGMMVGYRAEVEAAHQDQALRVINENISLESENRKLRTALWNLLGQCDQGAQFHQIVIDSPSAQEAMAEARALMAPKPVKAPRFKWVCLRCGKRFETESELTGHNAEKHPEPALPGSMIDPNDD